MNVQIDLLSRSTSFYVKTSCVTQHTHNKHREEKNRNINQELDKI